MTIFNGEKIKVSNCLSHSDKVLSQRAKWNPDSAVTRNELCDIHVTALNTCRVLDTILKDKPEHSSAIALWRTK